MMDRIKILMILMLVPVMISCFSVKSEYQPINYYRLNQEPMSAKNLGKINVTMMIRGFTASSEFDTEQIIATWEENKVQPYFYHRWASDCSEMVTDFFFTRFSNTKMFTGGVVGSHSWVVPDYFIEAKIQEMMAYSSNSKTANSNYVNVSLQISLARRSPLSTEKEIVFSENYQQRISRSDNSIATIVPAFSKAVSQIADMLMLDIQSAVAIDQRRNSSNK